MSTQTTITIGRGQGITQAIASKLNLNPNDLKKIDTGIWSQVLSKVKSEQSSNANLKNASTDYDQTTKNFAGWDLKEGASVTISESKFQEIRNLIQSKLVPTALPKPKQTLAAPNIPIKGLEVKPPEEQPVAATGKQLTRYVDGKKQTIEIGQNGNGQKTRYLVNEDGSRGEELVTMTTVEKNTYQTKSKFEADVKSVLGLGENEQIPANLKPFYVEIGGEAQLMFKSGGETLTPKQALALVNQNKSTAAAQTPSSTQAPASTSTPPTTAQEGTTAILNDEQADAARNARGYETTTASQAQAPSQTTSTGANSKIWQTAVNYAIEIDYKTNGKDLSQLANGAEIIYNGTPCHVQKDRLGIHLIDNSGKEIHTENYQIHNEDISAAKPAEQSSPTSGTSQTQSNTPTYIKTGAYNFNETPQQEFWTKNGQI